MVTVGTIIAITAVIISSLALIATIISVYYTHFHKYIKIQFQPQLSKQDSWSSNAISFEVNGAITNTGTIDAVITNIDIKLAETNVADLSKKEFLFFYSKNPFELEKILTDLCPSLKDSASIFKHDLITSFIEKYLNVDARTPGSTPLEYWFMSEAMRESLGLPIILGPNKAIPLFIAGAQEFDGEKIKTGDYLILGVKITSIERGQEHNINSKIKVELRGTSTIKVRMI